ncbi:MAG: ribonuclease R [Woeseiaceae bacterium]|nr:ribonuclease R [Woeseiaceae bacterium]
MSRRKKSAPDRGQKYKHPIPRRGEILDFLRAAGQPLKAEALMSGFGLKGKRMRTRLLAELGKMVRAGQIIENRRGEFCLLEKLSLITGAVTGHMDGYGFVIRDDGGEDMYVSPREMRALFHGDRVAVRSAGVDHRGREQANVVEVLDRGTREVVGEFVRERGVGVVIPDNPRIAQRILIARGESGQAKHGQIVVARILDYPDGLKPATGKIVRVVGDPDQKGIVTDIAIQSHGIPTDWPKAVREQAKSLGREVPEKAKRDRIDLRDVNLVTIDGADARDFDDAVYCAPSGKGYRLLVAIADVSHYVEKGSPLDKQAIRRGTSVYFPDRVVPMLPEALSNGLCSLKPKVDRLCMVCEMQVSAEGKVTRARFYQAVMRSAARLTYSQVHEFLTGQSKRAVPKALQEDVRRLHDVYRLFAKVRRRRGALELDIPQTRIDVNAKGEVTGISAMPRNDAHRLIEECMIAANVQAARFLKRHRIAGLYRVHAKPDPDKFEEVRQYLLGLGLKVPHPDHVQPGQLNKLLEKVRQRPDSVAISMALLRAMAHAEYTPNNIGHFGLALESYAHFTSPIRRYPDLLVHRAIRHILNGGKAGNYPYDRSAMEQLGAISSEHERRAEDATREVEAWLKCQYMEDKLGQQFDGVVTSVTNFGLFVQIQALQVDGLVHVTSLQNDYYRFDAGSQSLIGDRSGRQYRLGDTLQVVVSRVDLETKRIDFQLAGNAATGKRRR